MKSIILAVVLGLASLSFAEVGVKVTNVDTTQDTTISVQKGRLSNQKHYVVSEGEQEVTGDKDVVAKSAEMNWKKECNEWKKEFREDNKENRIISISCGKMKCIKEGVETTCASTAKYKIKTLAVE